MLALTRASLCDGPCAHAKLPAHCKELVLAATDFTAPAICCAPDIVLRECNTPSNS